METKTCCFSGNRPEKLPWKFDEGDRRCLFLKEELRKNILHAISDTYLHFISGMAQGVDMFAAEEIVSLKNDFNIFLECAVPYEGQEKKWATVYQDRYNKILSQADIVTYISSKYHPSIYKKRNLYMINKSSLLIAASTGKNGGTKQTISFAKEQNKQIVYIDIKKISTLL